MMHARRNCKVNAMQLLLLHPRCMMEKNNSTFFSVNSALRPKTLRKSAVSFSAGLQDHIQHRCELHSLCVIKRLFQMGCSNFVRNVALRHQKNHARATHIDLLAYHQKSNKMFIVCSATCKKNMHKAWLHNATVLKILREVVNEDCNFVQIVTKKYLFQTTARILFQHSP